MLSPKENVKRLYNKQTPEYLPFMGQGIINNIPVNGYRERSELGQTGLDWFGVTWIWAPDQPGPMPALEGIFENIADWRTAFSFPDLDAWDWEKAAELDRIPQFDFENNLLYQMIHNGLFERMHELMGFENAVCALLTDPDEVSALFDALADYKCKLIDKLSEYYHPDIICYHDDWGAESGLLFSPEIWRTLIKAPTKRIIDHIHSKGIFAELHCCGDIRALIPEIADDLGVDGLNIQAICDIPAMKKLTGNKVVYNVYLNTRALDVRHAGGNLTDEQVREAIRNEMLANMPGGCYIPQMQLVKPAWIPIIEQEYESCKYNYSI